MTIYCSGKQGAAVYVRNVSPQYIPKVEVYQPSRDTKNPPKWGLWENENGTDRILLFESTSIRVDTSVTQNEGYAVWRVYTATTVNGRVVEAYRGAFGKLHSQSFLIYKPTSSSNRLTHSGAPTGTLASWTSSTTSWINRTDFSHGDPVIPKHHIKITSAEGFLAYQFVKDYTPLDFSVHCGCNYNNCQKGTFPQKYCCFSCSDVNRWLLQIKADCNRTKEEIQAKLGVTG